jgi:hypothetical protein
MTLVLVGAAVLIGGAPAGAQVSGDCSITFNGVGVDRVDSLNSPLELGTDDTLIFSGIDPEGTRSAEVRMVIGPVTVESNTTTYATAEEEFLATITLDDVSPYGVGLFRAEGETDGCSAAVWIRVSGRFPFATLTGLTALGLTLGGITGQLGAIASRRRWARSAAALGGIATGTGLTLVGQEFGRLQVSYPSLGATIAAVAALGFILASVINPSVREKRRSHRTENAAPRPVVPDPQPKPDPIPAPIIDQAPTATEAVAEPAPVPKTPKDSTPSEPTPSEPTPELSPPAGPYWCYVMAPTDVFDLTDHTKTIAAMSPGNWYLAKRTLGGWVHVVVADGAEGWVAEGAINRQG